ncbi:hypothetical protein WN48_10079 [Eufriesea mexicana]|uniref:Uncharacterized protein n=1 Tax=Eufriesea mexicana TaxID=516756 RepID=A0A310SMV3_9HYME|nr:hypothetical protein WN48_10079 [Eufriesea mexicana]
MVDRDSQWGCHLRNNDHLDFTEVQAPLVPDPDGTWHPRRWESKREGKSGISSANPSPTWTTATTMMLALAAIVFLLSSSMTMTVAPTSSSSEPILAGR